VSKTKEYTIDNVDEFKIKILQWSTNYNSVAILDSNNYNSDKYSKYDYIAGIDAVKELKLTQYKGSFNKLKDFKQNNKNYIFGYFAYDLKNDIEDLKSDNSDNLQFPILHFFEPAYLIKIKGKSLFITSNNNIDKIFNQINTQIIINSDIKPNFFTPVLSKKEYINTVNKLKQHIQLGNIYEINFCQEYYTTVKEFIPTSVYSNLMKISPTPFSAFYKTDNNFLISATPERFIKKTGQTVISQPIKGTIKRDIDSERDLQLIKKLKNDKKELSENVMIVDLVRNDMSKFAKKGTVNVDELFEIYTFPQVHQMISTVTAEIEKTNNSIDIIKEMFPMGSMTGAPKIRAMQLIEKYEKSMRGLFSGAVGYFEPNGDFDFNVIIRSLFYNSSNNYLSFQVGSAITINSDAEKEYQECLIKAKAILLATNAKNSI